MFLAGNIEKSNKFSPGNMLKKLEKHAKNNEIDAEIFPLSNKLNHGYLDLTIIIKNKQLKLLELALINVK